PWTSAISCPSAASAASRRASATRSWTTARRSGAAGAAAASWTSRGPSDGATDGGGGETGGTLRLPRAAGLPEGGRPPDDGALRVQEPDGGPAAAQDRGQHGGGRGEPEHQDPRRRAGAARGDRRAEAGDAPRAQVDRELQDP